MFAGSIFYKAADGEIKELTAGFLRDKVRGKKSGISGDDLEDLVRVMAYYIQSREEKGLIREEDVDHLLKKLLPETEGDTIFVGRSPVRKEWLDEYLDRRAPGLPEPVRKTIAARLFVTLRHLREAGLREVLPETLDHLCQEQLRAMGFGFTSAQRLVFPLEEILAIYSRFSPFQAGDYFNEIVNIYLYNHFFMDNEVKSLETEGVLVRKSPSFFRVDRLDMFEPPREGTREARELALLNIFYSRAHYEAFPGENKALYRSQESDRDTRRILSGERFSPWKEGILAFTFASHENYSLFSLDESGFPVYPSCYNAEVDLRACAERPFEERLALLDRMADALNRFYRKYSEYFYLVDLLRGRNIYMNLYLDRDDPAYDVLLSNYLYKALDNEMIRIVLFNGSRSLDKMKRIPVAREGFPVELTLDPSGWNEKAWRYCRKNAVYMVSFEKI
ncbi:MAG TPA: hypothetical protein PLF44_06470 [Candidatus Mcinerneyibacteriales bacterium]|nr:hypothetical protein [Candidatus Mcinerneyibacteriales bacterium]